MCGNETPNERNYRLLKHRFANENETENKFSIHIELDFGNEPLLMKFVDLNGNETIHQVERVTGNGNETTLHIKNGNEITYSFKNENGNENGNGDLI